RPSESRLPRRKPHAPYQAARVHHAPRRRGGVASRGESAAERPGTAHRRAHADLTKTLLRGNVATPGSLKRVRTWVGPMARNARMDLRWAGGDSNRIRALAHELVGLQPTSFGLQPDIIPTGLDPGDGCPAAGNADDPDRLCEHGRSRRQRHRRVARPTEWEHH